MYTIQYIVLQQHEVEPGQAHQPASHFLLKIYIYIHVRIPSQGRKSLTNFRTQQKRLIVMIVQVPVGADLRRTDLVQWGIGLTPKRLLSRPNPHHSGPCNLELGLACKQ